MLRACLRHQPGKAYAVRFALMATKAKVPRLGCTPQPHQNGRDRVIICDIRLDLAVSPVITHSLLFRWHLQQLHSSTELAMSQPDHWLIMTSENWAFSVLHWLQQPSLSMLMDTRKHTSSLTGAKWVRELLDGHPGRFREQMGLSRTLFRKLSQELQMTGHLRDGRSVSVDEQLAIFLHFARTGSRSRMLQERFQRSGATVSKYVKFSFCHICYS